MLAQDHEPKVQELDGPKYHKAQSKSLLAQSIEYKSLLAQTIKPKSKAQSLLAQISESPKSVLNFQSREYESVKRED